MWTRTRSLETARGAILQSLSNTRDYDAAAADTDVKPAIACDSSQPGAFHVATRKAQSLVAGTGDLGGGCDFDLDLGLTRCNDSGITASVYNKLFTKILDSSIWLEPDATRIVWLTFIAVMDEDGFCHFSADENLRARARVTMPQLQRALQVLSSPDENSANQDYEGRRIERVPGGFIVLNAPHYRNIVKREHELELNRERVKRCRAKQKAGVTVSNDANITRNGVKRSVMQSEQSRVHAEKDRGAKGSRPTSKNGIVDSEWIAALEQNHAYQDLDVKRELAKMCSWCTANGKTPTRRRFVNWLNRCDKPIKATERKLPAPTYPQLPERRIPTDQEVAKAKAIAAAEVAKLREAFKMP